MRGSFLIGASFLVAGGRSVRTYLKLISRYHLLLLALALLVAGLIVIVGSINLHTNGLVILALLAGATVGGVITLVMRDKEKQIALHTGRMFHVSEQALSLLKEGMNHRAAQQLTELLGRELQLHTVTIIDSQPQVVASFSEHQSHIDIQQILQRSIVQVALNSSVLKAFADPEKPILVVPFKQLRQMAGALVIQCYSYQQMQTVQVAMAEGLGKLISYQLSLLETEKLRVLLKDTELRSLQAQINPHFLFNTLNTIVALIRHRPDEARAVMVELSNFMRLNLKLMASHLVPLQQELKLLDSYVNIIRVRFAEQLTVTVKINVNHTDYQLPPATIQPLVENCIQHGLHGRASDGQVEIIIQEIADGAEVIIRDNGSGIAPDILGQLAHKQLKNSRGNGIGVYNVNQRLTALLGEQAELQINNLKPAGCEVRFFLPRFN